MVRWNSTDISEEPIASCFSACHLLSCWFLAWLFLRPWIWRRHVPPTFNGLYGVIYHKIVPLMIIPVRTSNPACFLVWETPCIGLKWTWELQPSMMYARAPTDVSISDALRSQGRAVAETCSASVGFSYRTSETRQRDQHACPRPVFKSPDCLDNLF
jgi:hypothetical protein